MFEVIPCIDIQSGKVVRLFEGDPDKETIYFSSPLEAAAHWLGLGAKTLHLVDLDAALGKGQNQDVIKAIAQLEVATEVGGGIRDLVAAQTYLQVSDRVILGTAAISQPELVDSLLGYYGPERIMVSIDAKAGRVAVKGWQELSAITATELARRVEAQGIRQVIYTDISRDGTLQGVNPEPVQQMRDTFPHTLIAGGGVARDADLELYKNLGLEGAIVGRALYEGTISYPYPSSRPR